MARNKDLIVVSTNGRGYTADLGSTAPTDAITVPSAFAAGDLGWCHEDGLVLDLSEDRQEFGGWGTFGTLRTQVTKRTRTFKITPQESSLIVLSLYDQVAVPTPDGDGDFDYQINDESGQDLRAFIFDTIDGGKYIRYYVANGEITGRAGVTHNQTTRTVYEFTITAYPDDSGNSIHKFMRIPELAS